MAVHSRTGSAVFEYLHNLNFVPTDLYLAGIGVSADDALQFQKNWPAAEIVGFEPNPYSFSGLVGTFPGTLLNEALSDKDEVVDLHYRYSWKNGSSLYKPNEKRWTNSKINAHPLDSYSPSGDSVLLWLDVEGHELKVLQGATAFLTHVKAINIEMTGRPRAEGWASPLDVHKFLRRHGFYQVYTHTIRTCRGQFDAIYVRRELVDPAMCSCLETLFSL